MDMQMERLKKARENAAHKLAHPLTYSETVCHGIYFGALFVNMHEVYVFCGGILFVFVVLRLTVGVQH